MNWQNELHSYIQTLTIIDTHEHLPFEKDRLAEADVLSEWLTHYFSCDLASAGLSDENLTLAKDSSKDLLERWAAVEPFWHAAESTGYGRSLAIAARDIYGINRIDRTSIAELDLRFKQARDRGGHYRSVLKDMCRIAVSIRDSVADPYRETEDPFVFAYRIDDYICPTHYMNMRCRAAEVGMEVHTLADWMEVTRRQILSRLNGKTRVVCLKCALAYQRGLRFDKVTQAAAEQDFNAFFADGNLPDWRAPFKAGKALNDWMMHFICSVADEHHLTYQIHTGLQEGNGNFIYDSNPVLLTNLFLEYRHVRFDIFHMGYPYMLELGNLAKNFRNVFIDMCWGNIISPEAATQALAEWLDTVPANKISAFGGDYCFVDGVYGHQYIARQNVSRALTRKVSEGAFDLVRAKEIASWIFYENPKNLFNLDRLL